MRKIKLISDSTCDLSPELIHKHEIEIVPLYVSFGEESYKDGIDLKTEEMYRIIKEKGELPKTSAVAPGEFEQIFQKYLDLDYDILYMGIGSKFSGTFQSAMLAKKLLESENIYLVDSANLSSGTGLLLLKAAQFRDAGMGVLEIKEKVEGLVPLVRSQFVIDTLEYLYKGGRLNALSALMGKMLRVHPLIKVVDGKMDVGKKAMGSMRKGLQILLDQAVLDQENMDQDFMMITHSLADEHYQYIHKKIAGAFDIKNVYETHAGCVISTHCGAGTIGILYILKNE
ncbi:MAG: DegV family protein [Candidatus Izemoplasmataceae bacterium]